MGEDSLEVLVDANTREGELYEKLPENKLRCFACGHRCLIFDGKRGICQVRYNRGGKLFVPYGYVGALQCDPTEKKPFFHVLPGSRSLTFGMLGCDFHCSYCFSPETRVVTDKGVFSLASLFEKGEKKVQTKDGYISIGFDFNTPAKTASYRKINKVFKHPYRGELVRITPYFLPSFDCTPHHKIYTTLDPKGNHIQEVPAGELTPSHFLVVPKKYHFSDHTSLDVFELLSSIQSTYRVPHRFNSTDLLKISELTHAGFSSRQIGAEMGKGSSYIRHVRSKIARGLWKSSRVEGARLVGGRVKFYKEKSPGIFAKLPQTEYLGRLLGFYCAEGCVSTDRQRPNSYTTSLSFGPKENSLALSMQDLLRKVLGTKSIITKRRTTISVSSGVSSVSLFFLTLCGKNAFEKHVPEFLFNAPRNVVEAFLSAYILGDGHRYENGKVSVTTVSSSLAYGVAWLAMKTGKFTSLYVNSLRGKKTIEGREVFQREKQYTVVWYDKPVSRRQLIETDKRWLVSIRSLQSVPYSGFVYNMEVEKDHNYLANFFCVKNCQNWDISQAIRDPESRTEPTKIAPEKISEIAHELNASLVVSSYNEPLITTEWAVSVFKVAREKGFKTAYVSNGNGTEEVLRHIRPTVDCYKVDLKGMRQENYRQLGGKVSTVLGTIQRLVDMKFWVEIVTLIIPGFNDSDKELTDMAKFLVSVSPRIPWHMTAFHKDYKMKDPDNTPASTLIRAAKIGEDAGLKFVYAGNLPGMVGNYENTYCPSCQTLLVERCGFKILRNTILPDGQCPSCHFSIPGIWS